MITTSDIKKIEPESFTSIRNVVLLFLVFLILVVAFNRDNILIMNKKMVFTVSVVIFPLGFASTFYIFSRIKLIFKSTLPVLSNPIIWFPLGIIISVWVGTILPFLVVKYGFGICGDLFNKDPYMIEKRVISIERASDIIDTFTCKVYVQGEHNEPTFFCIERKFGLPAVKSDSMLAPGDKVILVGRQGYTGVVIDEIKKVQ